MTTPLLKTKLHKPSVPVGVVPKLEVLRRMDEGLQHGRCLTLVSAAAGFGKTTLVCNWLASGDYPSAWISLDSDDNNPTRFWRYVILALQGVDPSIGQASAVMLRSLQAPAMEPVLVSLLNDITATSTRIILVLDDYHFITEPEIHQQLSYLVDHLPYTIHIVLSTRADPPLAIARLRARRQLTEVRVADLRFSREETSHFLRDVMGVGISDLEIEKLDQRIEGWAAGLYLAGLSLKNRTQESAVVARFTDSFQYVLEYLMEEVLEQQPADVQGFLLQTSILERMNRALCEAVWQPRDNADRLDMNAQLILDYLIDRNLFIVPLDAEGSWFRYHHLFSSLLQHFLHRTYAPETIVELHRRASIRFEIEQQTDAALHHALAAGDVERSAVLVEQAALPMLMQGELLNLQRWLDMLPREVVNQRPWSCIYYAWTYALVGQLEKVPEYLRSAEKVLIERSGNGSVKGMRGHIAAIRAYLSAMIGDIAGAEAHAQQALALLPNHELAIRGVVMFTLGGVLVMQGDTSGATTAFTEAAHLAIQSKNLHVAIPALSSVASLQVQQGQLKLAERTYLQVITQTGEWDGERLPLASMAMNGLGRLYYEWNELEKAADYVSQALDGSRRWGNVETQVHALLTSPRIDLAQREMVSARMALEQALELISNHSVTPTTVIDIQIAWSWLLQAEGQATLLERWLEDQHQRSAAMPEPLRESLDIAVARTLIAIDPKGRDQATVQSALETVNKVEKTVERGGRAGYLVQAKVVKAKALLLLSRTNEAKRTLNQALVLASTESYIRTFVDEGADILQLLHELIVEDYLKSYVRTLVAAYQEREESPGDTPQQDAITGSLPEPLTAREIEILRLIAAGKSNNAIATELYIAVGTVKAHTSNIYSKLGVRNRTHAVAQARTLGIIV